MRGRQFVKVAGLVTLGAWIDAYLEFSPPAWSKDYDERGGEIEAGEGKLECITAEVDGGGTELEGIIAEVEGGGGELACITAEEGGEGELECITAFVAVSNRDTTAIAVENAA